MHRAWLAPLGLAALLAACAPAAAPSTGPPSAATSPAADAGAGRTGPAPVAHVRHAYPSQSLAFAMQFLAAAHGYYAEEGLDVELVQMQTAPMLAALTAGEVDYISSSGATLAGILQGLPMKYVAGHVRAPQFTLVAGAQFAAVADLRGAVIGVQNYGSSNDETTRAVLRHFGLQPERDVEMVAVGQAPAQYEALRLGRVTAAALAPPWELRAESEGYRILVNYVDVLEVPTSGLATREERLTTKADETKRLLRAELRAQRLWHTDRQAAVQLAGEKFGLDPALAERAYDLHTPAFSPDGTISRRGIETLLAMQREARGSDLAEFTYERLVDTAILETVQRELGITPTNR